MTKTRLGRIIALSTSVTVMVLGVLYIVFAAHLYFTGGERPYSRDRVGEYLLPLLIPSLITVGLALFGLIYHSLSAKPKEEYSSLPESYKLSSYSARLEGVTLEGEKALTVAKEKKKRLLINLIFTSLSAVFFLSALVYVIFFATFTVEELNSDMMSAFSVALPLMAISAAVHIPRLYLAEISSEKELSALKEAVKEGTKLSANKAPKQFKNENKIKLIATLSVLSLALVFTLIGVFNGGMGDVLAKAIKICTECIGLG